MNQNKFTIFFKVKFHSNLKFVLFSAVQENKKKQLLRKIVNCIYYRRCLANENFTQTFDDAFFLAPSYNAWSKIADLSHYSKIVRKQVKLKVTF